MQDLIASDACSPQQQAVVTFLLEQSVVNACQWTSGPWTKQHLI